MLDVGACNMMEEQIVKATVHSKSAAAQQKAQPFRPLSSTQATNAACVNLLPSMSSEVEADMRLALLH